MTTPSPFSLEPNSRWYGNDGNWSTFSIGVGQPFQQFAVLPSTRSADVWVPVADGCTGLSWDGFDCANSRGVGTVNRTQSPGFLSNESTSWQQLGIYQLPTQRALYGDENNGLYGLDTLALSDRYEVSFYNWTIAGIATPDFWLGTLGLGSEASEFTVLDSSVPSLLSTMKSNGKIPSISYGYAAGAYYDSSPASLTLGGWDEARMLGDSIVVPKDNGSDLFVSVQSLIVSNSLLGTISFPEDTKNLSMAIDSTTSQMWLPRNICDQLEKAFGLTFDENTGLYLVNTTAHGQLLNLNPEITFTLAANVSSHFTTNIALPYAAFDLTVGVPFYNSTSTIRYLPIRRANNATQYTLGRVLLQEAYLIVDYERGNFTIGPANHTNKKRVVPILSPQPGGKNNLESTAIIGIVVGIVAFVALLWILVWMCRRRLAKKIESEVQEMPVEEHAENPTFNDSNAGAFGASTINLPNKQGAAAELMSESVHELPEEQIKYQLMSNAIHELPGNHDPSELHAHTREGIDRDGERPTDSNGKICHRLHRPPILGIPVDEHPQVTHAESQRHVGESLDVVKRPPV